MPGVATFLYHAGGMTLALLPLIMTLANRSSPAVMAIASLFLLSGLLVEKGRGAWALLASPLVSTLGLVACAFLAWCAISVAWSPFPTLSLRVLSEFGGALVAGYLVALIAPGRQTVWLAPLAALFLVLASLFVVASLALDLAPQKALGQRAADFGFNRPVVTLGLLALPLTALLLRRGWLMAAVAILPATGLAALRSVSGASVLGISAGLAVAALALFLPKKVTMSLVGIGLGLALALSPIEGDILHRVMPDSLHERLFHASSRARVAIAQSFGAAVAEDPVLGAGYGTSARIAEVPAVRDLEPEMRTMLRVGHPHNSFLQVWTELGLFGAILAAAVMFLALQAIATLPRATFAAALGLVTMAGSIALVDHSAWAAWWTAGLAAAITWLREASVAPRREGGSE